MKKSLLLLFSLVFFTAQDAFANYFFNQIATSVVAGGAAAVIYKASNNRLSKPNTNTFIFLGSYITLKFFHDALNANTVGGFFKSFLSVPLNTGVAFGSCVVVSSCIR